MHLDYNSTYDDKANDIIVNLLNIKYDSSNLLKQQITSLAQG